MLLATTLLQKQLAARKRKRVKPRALPPPQGIEYQRAAVNYARLCERVVREYLIDRLPALLEQSAAPVARTDDLNSDIERALRTIRMILEAGGASFVRTVEALLEKAQQKHARDFVFTYGTTVPGINPLIGAEPWLREQFALALAENARLVKSIPEQLLNDVQSVINRGALDGATALDIGAQIARKFGVTESRARFIARDQTAKWHSTLNRLRQVDAGIAEYEWSTSLDDRVRPTHQANEGKRFRWDKPPEKTGHPGHDPNCRCTAIPVIAEYEDEQNPRAGDGPSFEQAVQARQQKLAESTASQTSYRDIRRMRKWMKEP